MKQNNFKLIILLFTVITGATLTSCNDNDGVSDAEQYDKEQALISEYLTANGLTAKTDTSQAKLKYIINTEGTGDYGTRDSVGLVDLKGNLLTGESFLDMDSTYLRIDYQYWITGYYLLMPYLREGGEMSMFLPSFYAYGKGGSTDGSVPGNTPIKVDVKLREVVSSLEYEQRVIDAYLDENNLTAQIDSVKGLRYIIEEEGTGNKPTIYDDVKVDYEGYLLGLDTSFDDGTDVQFDLTNLIDGWKILMPYVKEGGTITMFIPSKYGYGSAGSGSIPRYATLKFTVKLKSIVL